MPMEPDKTSPMTGTRVGRLLIFDLLPKFKSGPRYFMCKCDCGVEKRIRKDHLTDQTTLSCGCLGRERTHDANGTHYKTKTPEFRAWMSMKERCLNPNSKSYHLYKNRLICDRWLNSFENFYSDMGDKPTSKHSLDRRDNDKGYSPENCRWATIQEQNLNKSNARPVRRSDGQVYTHISVAAISVRGDKTNIARCCKSGKAYKGFRWNFI